jgi:hypothetical protein
MSELIQEGREREREREREGERERETAETLKKRNRVE